MFLTISVNNSTQWLDLTCPISHSNQIVPRGFEIFDSVYATALTGKSISLPKPPLENSTGEEEFVLPDPPGRIIIVALTGREFSPSSSCRLRYSSKLLTVSCLLFNS